MRHLITCLALTGCLDTTPAARETCEQTACAYVTACSPLTTGAWDWRSEDACLASFSWGSDPDACIAAVLDLPCLSSPPTDEEIVANLRALKLVRLACD